MKNIFVLLFYIIICLKGYAENHVISVIDKETQKPIPFANVCFEGLETSVKHYEVTSKEGIAVNPVKEESEIAISYVGYKTVVDTIQPNESKTYFMEQDLFDMEQVVVTGTRTRKVLAKSPVLTKVIINTELTEAGAVTALDALEYSIPGVQFSPDAHGDNLQIQGLDNDYILVLVDGNRMVGETRGNVNFDRLSAENIKRIEIVNGASSVLYGSNAIGAVINIITTDGKYMKPFQATVSSRYSANNELLTTANVGFSEDKFSMTLNGFRSSTDGYDLTPESPASYSVDKNTDYSGKIRLGYKINNEFSVNAHGTYYQHEITNPEKSTKSTHDLNKNYTFGGKVQIIPGKKHSLEFKGNADIYNAFTVYEKKDDEKGKDSDYRYTTLLFTDAYQPNEKLEIVGGAEINFEKIYSLNLFGEGEGEDEHAHDLNAFAQVDYLISKNFEVVAGVRNTYHSNYGNHLTPKVSLMYSPGKFKFRGNLANGYKAPTLKELYYNFDHHGMFMIYGNPDLKPENAFYTSLSGEYTKKTFNISLNTYYNSIRDKIESVDRINSETDILEKHYLNVSEALLKGFESYLSVYVIRNLVTKIGYAYSDAEDKSTGLQLYGNSKHSGTFALTYKLSGVKFPFSISLNGRASSGRLYQEAETETNEETGEEITTITRDESSAYSIWKLTYNQELQIAQKIRSQVQLGVNNIFDYTDKEDLAVIDPGRRFFAGIKFIF
ncbi:TonB-dependent receptor [Maribellus comscasis]|uniref:TonB-dependent receptor n=1 Tax=Maribellus comscasis TaxID=2681766 RepID=A0A6I6JYH1_9BACT|nr:TonB-dependent receptor [Maribellus comscasis]QGY47601.1 TonB-dependent receptor [Maribellus comscasis]